MRKIVLSLLLIGLLLSGCKKTGISSSYAGYQNYTKYLELVDEKADTIDLYYSQLEENNYNIQIKNNSSNFFQGSLDLYDDNSQKLINYNTKLIAPNNFEPDTVSLNGNLYSFAVIKYQFYQFKYPNIDYDYVTYIDRQEETFVIDILLNDQLNIDDIKTVAKYEYAKAVVTDQYPESLCFYDNNLSYYENEDGDDYPDQASAVYKVTMNFNDKNMTIINLNEEESTEGETINMP